MRIRGGIVLEVQTDVAMIVDRFVSDGAAERLVPVECLLEGRRFGSAL